MTLSPSWGLPLTLTTLLRGLDCCPQELALNFPTL